MAEHFEELSIRAHGLYHRDWSDVSGAKVSGVGVLSEMLPRLQSVTVTFDELGFESLAAVEAAIADGPDEFRYTHSVDRDRRVVWRRPFVEQGAYVDPSASLLGAVFVRSGCFIGPGAVVRMDEQTSLEVLEIGQDTNLQDLVVVHASPRSIGQRVILAHGSVAHGCTLEDEVAVYIKAIVDTGAVVGHNSFVDAAAYIGRDVKVPPNRYIAPSTMVNSNEAADRLPALDACHREMQKQILEHNRGHTERYLKAQQESLMQMLDN